MDAADKLSASDSATKSRRYNKSGTNKAASLMQLCFTYLKHMILTGKHKENGTKNTVNIYWKKLFRTPRLCFTPVCFTPFASTPLTDLQYVLFTPSHFGFNALWLVYFQLLLVFLWEYHIWFTPTSSGTWLGHITRLWCMLILLAIASLSWDYLLSSLYSKHWHCDFLNSGGGNVQC